MQSIGIDMVEIERIRCCMKNPRFLKRILGPIEYNQLEERNMPVQSVAAAFSAKEAFAKAIGTGVKGFSLNEVMLLREDSGRPFLQLSGRAKIIAEQRQLVFSVSVTHTREMAAAVVLAMGRDDHR